MTAGAFQPESLPAPSSLYKENGKEGFDKHKNLEGGKEPEKVSFLC